MTELLHPETPCTVDIETASDGGVMVTLRVPTYGGGATFQLHAERSSDGDWRVFIPWPDAVSESVGNTYNEDGIPELAMLDGMEVANGILYLGAPDVPVPATWQRASQEHAVVGPAD